MAYKGDWLSQYWDNLSHFSFGGGGAQGNKSSPPPESSKKSKLGSQLEAVAEKTLPANSAVPPSSGWLHWRPKGTTSCANTTNKEAAEPSSDLFDLIKKSRNWHQIVRHCKQHPIDAKYQSDNNLETPLYLACQNQPPVRVIRALLTAFPEAAESKSRNDDDLPIHIACRYNASTDVIRELVKNHPLTASYASKEGDKTPFHALWDGRDKTDVGKENYSSVFWQKVQVLLEAVAMSRNQQQSHGQQQQQSLRKNNNKYMLHAAASLGELGCPLEMWVYALQKYPDQVKVRDGSGRLPLHIAVGPSKWSEASRLKYLPREQQVISRLLELYPESARLCDPNEPKGRFPIHTALSNRHAWHRGVKELFEAMPEALLQLDPMTSLYPFQLAAIPVGETVPDLDTIYRLLQVQPAVVQVFGKGERDTNACTNIASEQQKQTPEMASMEEKKAPQSYLSPLSSVKKDLGTSTNARSSIAASDQKEHDLCTMDLPPRLEMTISMVEKASQSVLSPLPSDKKDLGKSTNAQISIATSNQKEQDSCTMGILPRQEMTTTVAKKVPQSDLSPLLSDKKDLGKSANVHSTLVGSNQKEKVACTIDLLPRQEVTTSVEKKAPLALQDSLRLPNSGCSLRAGLAAFLFRHNNNNKDTTNATAADSDDDDDDDASLCAVY